MQEAIDALFHDNDGLPKPPLPNGWVGTVEADSFGWNVSLTNKESATERASVSGYFSKAKAAKRFIKEIVKVKVTKEG